MMNGQPLWEVPSVKKKLWVLIKLYNYEKISSIRIQLDKIYKFILWILKFLYSVLTFRFKHNQKI